MRIGLLGAARITPSAIVAPAKVMSGAVLQGIAARDRRRADAFAAQHGVAKVFDHYADLILAPDIDLVYNALPINCHARQSIDALAAGKHVLCEKPLAMNAREVHAMLDAATASGARLIEAFHYRYHPAFGTLLAWIASGEIGAVQQVVASFDVAIADNGHEIRHRPETGGGAMMDLGCYPLNWALQIMDAQPTAIVASATMTASGVDESMSARLTFADGAVATVRSSMACGKGVSARLRVTGSDGEIDFVNPLSPHTGAMLQVRRAGKTVLAPISRISTYTYQLSAVLDGLAAGATLPTEGAILLRQQQTLDAIYAAAGLAHLRCL